MDMSSLFTKEEKIDFLIKEGYTIETIKCWEHDSYRGNDIEDSKIRIAYLHVKPQEGRYIHDYFFYTIDNVFKEIMRKKLLQL